MRARIVAAFAVILACAGGSGPAASSAPPTVSSVSLPGCSMASAQEPLLAGVRTAMVTDRGTSPFGIVVTPDGRWAFAALGSSVEVYRIGLSLAPVAVRAIPVPATNRFGVHSASSDLSVVNVAAALAGRPAVIGSIPAGLFPREMALVPGAQRLLITNYQSGQLEAVSVPNIR